MSNTPMRPAVAGPLEPSVGRLVDEGTKGRRMNLRCKWVGRWSGEERQLRLFRVMWESFGRGPDPVARYSHKVSVSIKHWLPWVTVRRSAGGLYV